MARTFKLKRYPQLTQPRVVTDEEMADMFGQRSPTSEHCLSQMVDPVRRAGIRFVNELLNLKHVASYIAKGVMGPVIDAEAGKNVDWAEFLYKSLEKELRVIDVNKGKTRMAAHIYLLLGIDPTTIPATSVEMTEVPKDLVEPRQSKPAGKSILDTSSNKKVVFKKRKRSDRQEKESEAEKSEPGPSKTVVMAVPIINLTDDNVVQEERKELQITVENTTQLPQVLHSLQQYWS